MHSGASKRGFLPNSFVRRGQIFRISDGEGLHGPPTLYASLHCSNRFQIPFEIFLLLRQVVHWLFHAFLYRKGCLGAAVQLSL